MQTTIEVICTKCDYVEPRLESSFGGQPGMRCPICWHAFEGVLVLKSWWESDRSWIPVIPRHNLGE